MILPTIFFNFRATCKGKAIPDDHVALLFFEAIDKILSKKKNALIGVHCTYGLNRTGYMICRYLIQKKGWKPQKAIEAFNEARGHSMERENYIKDLKKATWNDDLHLLQQNGGQGEKSGGKIEEQSPFC